MSDLDEMEMPCVCENCGCIFELNEGNPSSDRSDKNIYCSDCVKVPWGDLS